MASLKFAGFAVVLSLVLATGVAQAQSFTVLHEFTGGNDGAQPYAGLTLDRSGNLYGTTHSGNSGTNWGNIYTLRREGTGWIFQPLHLFDGSLLSGITIGPDGTLFGTSPNNLAGYYWGYIYRLTPPISPVCFLTFCTWGGNIIYHFSGGADGASPRYGDVIFDHAGNMYGTTAQGGNGTGGNGNGVVYEMTGSGNNWNEAAIYTFQGAPDGSLPYSGVVFDTAGNLYGTTTQGGNTGNGTVYKLTNSGSGWTEQILYNFQGGSDGATPTGGLIFDHAGNIYGTTNTGGSGGGGTVYELTPSGGGYNFNLLYSFSGTANCGPWGALALDGNGNLYGTTICDGAHSDGNVFKLTNTGSGFTYSSLYDFTGGADGRFPYCGVALDSAGNLYGTAFKGGNYNLGTAWEMTP